MTVGTSNEGGIIDNFVIGTRLFVVKERAIYEILMADHIDPGRTNAAIPNSQQRFLSVGAEDFLVSHVLLDAKEMFNAQFLPGFDMDAAMLASLSAVQNLLAMRDEAISLSDEVGRLGAEAVGKPLQPGFAIPAIDNLQPRCSAFIQRADRVVIATMDIARVFYGKAITHADSLLDFVTARYGPDDEFTKLVTSFAPGLRQIRKARNAVEHPKPFERLAVTNFAMLPDGTLAAPMIELVHNTAAWPATPLVEWLFQEVDELAAALRQLIAGICSRHTKFAGNSLTVMERPADRRLVYTVSIKGERNPLG